MTGQQTADSPPVKLVRSFAEGLARGDVDLVANQLHKDLRRIYHPRSLGQPEQTKEEYILHLTELFKLWPNGSQPEIHSITETPGTVVFHITTKAKTSIGVDMSRESLVIAQIAIDEDGSLKMKQIEEFTDSKNYPDFVKAASEAKANRENSSSHVA